MLLTHIEKLVDEAFKPSDTTGAAQAEPVLNKLAQALDAPPVGRPEVGLAKLLIGLDILSR